LIYPPPPFLLYFEYHCFTLDTPGTLVHHLQFQRFFFFCPRCLPFFECLSSGFQLDLAPVFIPLRPSFFSWGRPLGVPFSVSAPPEGETLRPSFPLLALPSSIFCFFWVGPPSLLRSSYPNWLRASWRLVSFSLMGNLTFLPSALSNRLKTVRPRFTLPTPTTVLKEEAFLISLLFFLF